jgi:hypothetical protein
MKKGLSYTVDSFETYFHSCWLKRQAKMYAKQHLAKSKKERSPTLVIARFILSVYQVKGNSRSEEFVVYTIFRES